MCSINHDLKAIYLHVPKTGGSYISSILSTYYGFKNYYLRRPDHVEFTKIIDSSVDKHENKLYGTYLYYSSSNELNRRMNMNLEKWKSYKIFSFVRDPIKRLLSGYQYVQQHGYYKNINIEYFCRNAVKLNCWSYWHCFMPQHRHLVNEKNENVCYFVGKHENLENDLNKILNDFNLKIIHKPYKKNITHQKRSIDYSSILNLINILIQEDKEIYYTCV